MIADAFDQSAQTHANVHQTWIRVSVRLSGALPNSRLMSSVQGDGRLRQIGKSTQGGLVADPPTRP
jgi:hypothetical protein